MKISNVSFFIMSMFIAQLSCARDSSDYGFRTVRLSDDVKSVEQSVRKEFLFVKNSRDSWIIKFSGRDKATEHRCPVTAPDDLRSDCLEANYVLWPVKGEHKLAIITVAQSFNAALKPEEVLEKLNQAYGKPRRIYQKESLAVEAIMPRPDDVGVVWGGDRAPAAPYLPATFIIAEDYDRIGGEYVTAVLHIQDHKVIGYQLQIVDSTRVVASMMESRMEEEEKLMKQRSDTLKSLKF